MNIQIHSADFPATPAIVESVENHVRRALQNHEAQVTRVEVHLKDVNAAKGGTDKRVLMEVRLAGQQPMAVEALADDLYAAIDDASQKLHRIVSHKLDRLHDRHH